MASIDILPRRSLRDDVFGILHKRIIAGEIHPGEWLRQEEIAAQFGVSMTPVREALDLLVSTGLASREPYRGVHVVELTREEMLDAYGFRLLLEPRAAWLAAIHGSSSQIENLRQILAETIHLVHLEDLPQLRELSRLFHNSLFMMSGSTLLERVYSMVANKFPDWLLYEAMFRHPEAMAESLRIEQAQHNAILIAIESKNSQTASDKAKEHILTIGKDLEIYLSIPKDEILEKEEIFSKK
jgi:DNA-binding GntR family transcriptional regulator